jgi:hypothetical protein
MRNVYKIRSENLKGRGHSEDLGVVRKRRGPFEKLVDWRQCAAVMQREAVTVSHVVVVGFVMLFCFRLRNSYALPPVHELFKRPS